MAALTSEGLADTHREIKRELGQALNYLEKGDYGLAEDCYAAALELAGGIGDPHLMQTILGYLARASATQGKHKMATTMYERQLHMLDASKKMDRVSVMLELVSLYRRTGREDDADAMNGEVTVLMSQISEPESPEASSDDDSDDDVDRRPMATIAEKIGHLDVIDDISRDGAVARTDRSGE